MPTTPAVFLLPVTTTPCDDTGYRRCRGPNGILRGSGETDSWKKTLRRLSRVRLPLKAFWNHISAYVTSYSKYWHGQGYKSDIQKKNSYSSHPKTFLPICGKHSKLVNSLQIFLYRRICSFASYSSCTQYEILFWKVYGMVRYGWPSVSGFSFRPENPPPLSMAHPPRVGRDRVYYTILCTFSEIIGLKVFSVSMCLKFYVRTVVNCSLKIRFFMLHIFY